MPVAVARRLAGAHCAAAIFRVTGYQQRDEREYPDAEREKRPGPPSTPVIAARRESDQEDRRKLDDGEYAHQAIINTRKAAGYASYV
jgi:hypothetical protein